MTAVSCKQHHFNSRVVTNVFNIILGMKVLILTVHENDIGHILLRATGAYVCLFAEMALKSYQDNQLISTMFQQSSQSINQEKVDMFRQEIGKIACQLYDESLRKE